ncbi:hypothetical protein F66182_4390 [Fusarium sp. NRRL 66182]|nr:hypothetical protein F66182_4390 [Fusarium sp. NRRL 66182]
MLVNLRGIRNAQRIDAEPIYTSDDVLVIVCAALALYNAVELMSLIFMTFKRRAGLYFWSILFTTFGVLPYCVGWLIVYFDLTEDYVGLIIDTVGWILLVTGQSVVLYSRLHLVVTDTKILRAVLVMIIINGVIWHVSITVLLFGSSFSANENKRGYNDVFNVLEKVQMTCFCLQELIISVLYIWKTFEILKTAFGDKRRVLWKLFALNLAIVVMNAGLLAVDYLNYYTWEQCIKVVTYSIKLKLEFAILSQLIDFIRTRGGTQSRSGLDYRSTGAAVPLSSLNRPQKEISKRASHIHIANPVACSDAQSSTHVSASKGTPEDASSDKIRVITEVDVESLSAYPRDDRSTDELYDGSLAEHNETKRVKTYGSGSI